ncbi:TRAP transporter large permease subunit (plasmid) [Salipiger sp. H15]|uniref:TRAP transporter large permease subunit n=1 Tax=Alloyangia sp. H15 TaxID=3029062 RepID=A0AAU8ASC2_9RHOB
MGMPTSGVYVLLAALVAPSLVEAGVTPIAAHLFILYFGMMSMITPPVALAAFAASAISGAGAVATGVAAMRVGWAAFILPFAFVATPALLLEGSLQETVLAAVLTTVGVGAVTIGITGYWARHLNIVLRIVFVILGAVAIPLGFIGVPMLVHTLAAAGVVILAAGLSFSKPAKAGNGQAAEREV